MKKLLGIILLAGFLSSCAFVATPTVGLVYTDLKAPLAVTGNSGSSKVGTGKITSILGIVATGDASIETAAKSAGITKIHHVDYDAMSVIGVYAEYTIYVYGE